MNLAPEFLAAAAEAATDAAQPRSRIELVYGPKSLMAVLVTGQISVMERAWLLMLIPRAKHDATLRTRWGLEMCFYDPHWTVPAAKPTGQPIAFLPPA